VLLGVAHVSPAEFERQAAQAGEDFERREHWAPTPAPRGSAPPAASPLAAHPAATAPAASTPPAARPADAASSPTPPVPAGMTCPSCGAALVHTPYEGIDIVVCDRCGGRLITSTQAGKLLARREAGFTEEQLRIADLLTASGDSLRRAAVLARGRSGVGLASCPKCSAPMLRRHYDYQHAVEVDRCMRCDLVWFEKDELEALQILVERQSG
jgi:Zn-finger nucleic acid-binding protein